MGLSKIGDPVHELGSRVDLNTITQNGVYHQRSVPFAAGGRNYPEPMPGLLEVHNPHGSRMVYQRYTIYMSGNVYYRGFSKEEWGQWRRLLTA